jgi:hypothetical protein
MGRGACVEGGLLRAVFTLCIMYNVDNIVLLWTLFASLLDVYSSFLPWG